MYLSIERKREFKRKSIDLLLFTFTFLKENDTLNYGDFILFTLDEEVKLESKYRVVTWSLDRWIIKWPIFHVVDYLTYSKLWFYHLSSFEIILKRSYFCLKSIFNLFLIEMLLGRYINIDFDDLSLDSNDSNKKKIF